MSREEFLLFCFPFAGGTIDFYNNIERACGDRVKFIKLEYSGHGTRMKEPLYESFEEMTADLFPHILQTLERYPEAEYSLLGYSMGSIAVFNMLQKIENENVQRRPWRVFLSAHQPQPISSLRNIPQLEVDGWVKDRTIEFGGVDSKLINNKIFWRVYLPIFRADYQMIAHYDFDSLIVEGIVRVMQGAPIKSVGEDGLPLPPYALYNIGGGTPENLLTYVSTLQEELVRAGVLSSDYDFEAHRELVGMQPGDVPVTYADSRGLEDDYGFRPGIDIRTGLRRFCEWYKGYYGD